MTWKILISLLALQSPYAQAVEATGKQKPVIADTSSLQNNELMYYTDGKYITVKIKELNEVKFDAKCFKSEKNLKCDAYSAFKNQHPKKLTGDNLGSSYCKAVGGRNLIALNQKRAEYNLCEFKDKSFFISWTALVKAGVESK